MVIGNRCGNIRAPDAVEAYSGIGRSGFEARERCSSSSNAAVVSVFAPVAQLDRAPGYEPGGREFESLRAHHYIQLVTVAVPTKLGTLAGIAVPEFLAHFNKKNSTKM